jgi:hypothetical protein
MTSTVPGTVDIFLMKMEEFGVKLEHFFSDLETIFSWT